MNARQVTFQASFVADLLRPLAAVVASASILLDQQICHVPSAYATEVIISHGNSLAENCTEIGGTAFSDTTVSLVFGAFFLSVFAGVHRL